MKRTPLIVAIVSATAGATALVAAAGTASAQQVDVAKVSASKVSSLLASRPANLHAGANDAFVQRNVYTSGNSRVYSYDRTFKGLDVVGGDFVIKTDATGEVNFTSVAQTNAIDANLSISPKLTAAQALAIAKKQLTKVTGDEGSKLVVVATGAKPVLAWQSTILGRTAEGPSRLTVDVDALTGAIAHTQEHVISVAGTGTGWINGANLPIDTTLSGSTYSLRDPAQTTLSCQDSANNTTFTKTSNTTWGSTSGTSKEGGCVNAFFVAQQQNKMLSEWLGRSGPNGTNGGWPIRVGLADINAYYDGTQVQIGHAQSPANWITSADVVAHEIGHGIDDNTPGGISAGGTQEFIADVFGAATEAYINDSDDAPDYLVGEEVNLVGAGPIRNMYNPSALGDPNCYSSSVPNGEVHASAGPGNHWFYLLAQGTSGNGQPASTTCNSTTITGIGIQNATKILYNAMLLKTSSSSYLKYRTWTLQAAKDLTPGNCTNFNTVKAAWDAVSVPAQSADPTCSGSTTPPPTTTPPTTTPPTSTPPGGCTGTNAADVTIPDYPGAAVYSNITISGCGRNAGASSTIAVDIIHTYRGDLRVDLVAPDGSIYNLKAESTGGSTDNVKQTFTKNLSTEVANGTWRLKVQDYEAADTGYINSWTLTL